MIVFLVSFILVFSLITAIITYAYLHQKKVVQLRTQLHEEELHRQQAVFDALQEGQEQERTRLAQEMHDGVGAKLSGLKMYLEHLKANTRENKALVEDIYSGLAETLDEVRAISHNLQPMAFGKGLEQLLQEYVGQLNASDTCQYSIQIYNRLGSLDKTVLQHSYRIVSELLNNIHKHAQASQASVQIGIENQLMEIVVEDNGIGLDKASNNLGGIGLSNIRSRVDVCKGLLNIDSSEAGTTVIIELPVNT